MSKPEIWTLNDQGTTGSTVLLRLDLNSPIDPSSGLILDDKRFREHLGTVRALEESRLVIITHQSRPGKKDFTTLSAHAERLGRLLHREVTYVDDIFGRCARDAVMGMERGEILMLENLRFNAEENLTMKPEEAKNTHIVRRLASMADCYVNDAFGTAHRSQPSIIGLPLALRSVAGLLMEEEISTLSKVFTDAPRPVTFVLGGTKVDDSIAVAEHVLREGIADQVFVTGVVANVFLLAAGVGIGKPSTDLIRHLGYVEDVERAKRLLAEFSDRIVLPEWVAVRENGERMDCRAGEIPADAPVLDLGFDSIASMTEAIGSSGTVVLNGPAGVFEDEPFALGTLETLRAASRAEFSVIGGGHTAVVIEKLGLDKEFTHISTGGGACIEFLTGRKLPAVAALEESKRLFG